MLLADHNTTCKSFSHTALMLSVTMVHLQEGNLTLRYHVNLDIMRDFMNNDFDFVLACCYSVK